MEKETIKEGVLEEMKKYYEKNKPTDIDGKPLTFDEFKQDMINAFEKELTYATFDNSTIDNY